MSWTRMDPGAGEPGSIRFQAWLRQTRADELRSLTLVNVNTAIADASSAAWKAKAATAFAASAQAFVPEVSVIISGLENDVAALGKYASDVEVVAAAALALRPVEVAARSDILRWQRRLDDLPTRWSSAAVLAMYPRLESDRARFIAEVADARVRIAEVDVRWDELASQRQAADNACVGSLRSTESRGNLARLQARNLEALSTEALLKVMGGMSAVELAILLQREPGLSDRYWDEAPDPKAVEEWWGSLDDANRAALVLAVPLVIGNLDGVPYGIRVQANKANIAAGIFQLEKEVQKLELAADDLVADGDYNAVADTAELDAQIAYYKDLLTEEMTFFDAGGRPVTVFGHNILVFDHGRDAIAEYSGLLDPEMGGVPAHVSHLGIYVPGTGSKLSTFGDAVDRSSFFIDDTTSGRLPGSVAMISWKGGAFPQGLEAVSGTITSDLGDRLAEFGKGLDGTHDATLTGVGYSAGGSILGSAERAGMPLDRSLHVSSAGMGHGVDELSDYPATSNAPHYSMMAPNDLFVGLSQGREAGDLGHGASPLDAEGFTRLETGHNVDGEPESGPIIGHMDVWDPAGTAMRQMSNVISGRDVELFANWENTSRNLDYRPRMVEVEGERE